MKHSVKKVEFGDFQTPLELARRCCRVMADTFANPATVIEPTCGQGAFLVAAIEQFACKQAFGFEVNQQYRDEARETLQACSGLPSRWSVETQDFFGYDWKLDRSRRTGPVLYLGNPPWVTNSQLGVFASNNLPQKTNVAGDRGIDAMTGRSNFDIAESILERLLQAMRPDEDCLAMLVKTSTARKSLRRAWKSGMRFSHASMRLIDAKSAFDVNVHACLLLLMPTADSEVAQTCFLAPSLEHEPSEVAFGWLDQNLVADPALAASTSGLESSPQSDSWPTWRSGVKHDVAEALELIVVNNQLQNRSGADITLERTLVYPLAKGADVANGRTECQERRILMTQRSMSDSTKDLERTHPQAWKYLRGHAARFAARKSSIYRNRDEFALFGIGPYTFAPWKVAICGLYKRLTFTVIGPVDDMPVILDDTCYFLPLESREQACFAHELLTSTLASDYFRARIFWDSKRPITAQVLRGVNLRELARQLDRTADYDRLFVAAVTT